MSICALNGKSLISGIYLFDLAFMSALPYYDSLISCPKPHLIPEQLLSIARVQLVCGFFPGVSLAAGRNFLPWVPELPGAGTSAAWARISGLSDRVPFRQGRGVNWLVPSSSSTPAPCTFSLRPGAPTAGQPPPGRLRPGFRWFFAGFASPRRGDPSPPLTFHHGRR